MALPAEKISILKPDFSRISDVVWDLPQSFIRTLEKRGILVRSVNYPEVAEEAGFAYKDIDEVVEAARLAGISLPVAKLVPLGNVKG